MVLSGSSASKLPEVPKTEFGAKSCTHHGAQAFLDLGFEKDASQRCLCHSAIVSIQVNFKACRWVQARCRDFVATRRKVGFANAIHLVNDGTLGTRMTGMIP